MVLKDPKGQPFTPSEVDGLRTSYYWLKTKSNKQIPAMYFHNQKNK
jgi:hypothetical protein